MSSNNGEHRFLSLIKAILGTMAILVGFILFASMIGPPTRTPDQPISLWEWKRMHRYM